MVPIELACVAILAVYLAAHARRRGLLSDAALVAGSALIGEDTCIRAYGFYQYAPGWDVFVDKVPALIVLIWPAVVLSGREVARALLGPERASRTLPLVLATGIAVTFDALLIEPIAVRAGLWSWNEPGIFDVPLIGILGWGFYAAAMTACLEHLRGRARLATLVLAPAATHAALLGAWWGLLRWIGCWPVNAWTAALVVLAVALVFSALVVSRRATLPWRELGPRAAATAFFAALLLRCWGDAALALYAVSFTPPHLVLVAYSVRAARAPASDTR